MSDIREASTDRAEGDQSLRDDSSPSTDADRMRDELRSVIASPDFARAPIMKRLLAFLVGETAAGRGDHLKAYSVAVDGLGRAPDYDARADSYPRVQVGRLRRMLDTHYSSTRPAGGLRLTIPSGRYRVALQPDQVEDKGGNSTAGPAFLPERSLQFGWQISAILAVVLLATMLCVQFLPLHMTDATTGRERPVMELSAVRMAKESTLGNQLRFSLINGLGRSGVYDLRPLRRSGTVDPTAPPARYRLGADLIEGEHPRLFLRLSRNSPDRLIWSGDISLGSEGKLDGEAIDRLLTPVIAAIGSVNGLVATHELQEIGKRAPVGHGCLLTYYHYRKERSLAEADHVRSCVEQNLKIDPGNADLQAAAAQLAIEKLVSSDIDPRDRAPLLQTARRHADLAGSIDPYDAWSNLARARVALARNACTAATRFAVRATQLQPYDPVLLSDAGLYLLDCDDSRAEEMIRRAIALDGDPDGRFHIPLLLLAMGRDDPAMAREALAQMTPPNSEQYGYFYLIDATGRAMIGDVAGARASWSQLATISPQIARDPQVFFERIGYAAHLRERAIGHLRRVGLIAQ